MITLGELLDAGAALGPEARDAVVRVLDFAGEHGVATVQYINDEKRFRFVVVSECFEESV
jgi:hypothetical protein